MHKYGNFFLANQNEYVFRLLKTAPFETLHSSRFTWTLERVLLFTALHCSPAPPFEHTFDVRGEDIPAMRVRVSVPCDECDDYEANANARTELKANMWRAMGRHTRERVEPQPFPQYVEQKGVRKTPSSIQCFVSSQSKITHLVALTRTHSLL